MSNRKLVRLLFVFGFITLMVSCISLSRLKLKCNDILNCEFEIGENWYDFKVTEDHSIYYLTSHRVFDLNGIVTERVDEQMAPDSLEIRFVNLPVKDYKFEYRFRDFGGRDFKALVGNRLVVPKINSIDYYMTIVSVDENSSRSGLFSLFVYEDDTNSIEINFDEKDMIYLLNSLNFEIKKDQRRKNRIIREKIMTHFNLHK